MNVRGSLFRLWIRVGILRGVIGGCLSCAAHFAANEILIPTEPKIWPSVARVGLSSFDSALLNAWREMPAALEAFEIFFVLAVTTSLSAMRKVSWSSSSNTI